MKPIVFHLPGDEAFADQLVRALQAERGILIENADLASIAAEVRSRLQAVVGAA